MIDDKPHNQGLCFISLDFVPRESHSLSLKPQWEMSLNSILDKNSWGTIYKNSKSEWVYLIIHFRLFIISNFISYEKKFPLN